MTQVAFPSPGQPRRRIASPSFRPGFTMVELVVVITICALLLSLLLPSLSQARKTASCVRWKAYAHTWASDGNCVALWDFDDTNQERGGYNYIPNKAAGGDAPDPADYDLVNGYNCDTNQYQGGGGNPCYPGFWQNSSTPLAQTIGYRTTDPNAHLRWGQKTALFINGGNNPAGGANSRQITSTRKAVPSLLNGPCAMAFWIYSSNLPGAGNDTQFFTATKSGLSTGTDTGGTGANPQIHLVDPKYVRIYTNGNNSPSFTSAASPTPTTMGRSWHSVVISNSGTDSHNYKLSVSIDGQTPINDNETPNSSVDSTLPKAYLTLGAYIYNGTGSHNGSPFMIDNATFWNRALDEGEMLTYYKMGAGGNDP